MCCRHTPLPTHKRQHLPLDKPLQDQQRNVHSSLTNGNSPLKNENHQLGLYSPDQKQQQLSPSFTTSDKCNSHNSRLFTFQNYQRNHPETSHQSLPDKPHHHNNHQSSADNGSGRSFSPLQSYQNHVHTKNLSNIQDRIYGVRSPLPQRRVEACSLECSPYSSPLPHRRSGEGHSGIASSPYLQRKNIGDNRRPSPMGSPLPLRNHYHQNDEQLFIESTSPIVLQRFYHQQKQQQQVRETEEAAGPDSGKCNKFLKIIIKFIDSSYGFVITIWVIQSSLGLQRHPLFK